MTLRIIMRRCLWRFLWETECISICTSRSVREKHIWVSVRINKNTYIVFSLWIETQTCIKRLFWWQSSAQLSHCYCSESHRAVNNKTTRCCFNHAVLHYCLYIHCSNYCAGFNNKQNHCVRILLITTMRVSWDSSVF